jgi:FkbM family methyltransferase
MTRTMPLRHVILKATERLGVEAQLRTVQRMLESPRRRRNRRDDENLQLLLAAVLAPDSNCIDVGANIGSTLASICAVAPDGKHIAYEPLPALCMRLQLEYPAVDVRQAALSNQAGDEDFIHVKHLPSRSGLRRPDYQGPQAETLRTRVHTLDTALEPDYVPALIKIDVEGAEQQVLEGARETIERHRPVIVFEHDPRWAAHYGSDPAGLHRFLSAELELEIFDMDGAGPLGLSLFTDLVRDRQRWNFFARVRR